MAWRQKRPVWYIMLVDYDDDRTDDDHDTFIVLSLNRSDANHCTVVYVVLQLCLCTDMWHVGECCH